MNVQKRFDLIKRNTQEVLTGQDLKRLLEKKKQVTAYHGVATSGPFHAAYLIPLGKLFDFNKANVKNKILIADIHAALDDLKAKWSELDEKARYYQKCIELSFPWKEKPKFVRGSSFQLKEDYQLDVLKMSTLATVTRAIRAASEVTRMKNPKVSELIYPIMQALDEEYLKADLQLGGIDQRHIMAFAREYLPKVKYERRVEVMTPLVVSLKGPGVKMSASIPESSIKVYESESSIKKKLARAYCPFGVVKDNPVLQLTKHIIFPVRNKIKVERYKKFGGDITFKTYEELEKVFVKKKLHPQDVKNTVSNELISIFGKVRKYFERKQADLKTLGNDFL